MSELTKIDREMLKTIADLHDIPVGAYNIRRNGEGISRRSTDEIEINTKTNKPGIDIIVKPGVKNRSVHIPVIITQTGVTENVYNDFYIGDGAEVLIVAGCGIHNDGSSKSQHDGIHTFRIGKNCKVRYVEKHYGEGGGSGERILNPVTELFVGENSTVELEMVQIKGVDSTVRTTNAALEAGASMVVTERLQTDGSQSAESNVTVNLNGEGSRLQVVSRSVAGGSSKQVFHPIAIGNCACHAHLQCDSIIMDDAHIGSIPEIVANSADAQIIHEAAIGRINNDQLVKLQTLGLTEEEAEQVIIQGFLR